MTGEGNELDGVAVRNLAALGLSEYAARTLAALTRLGGGSARDVSDASAVPRTRVYDAVEELSARGFVTVRESHPKEFEPAPPQRIRRAFYREYIYREVLAEWGLRSLSPKDEESSSNVLVETGSEAVDAHFHATIDEAEERLTYVAVEAPPSTRTLAALAEAADRDVTVRVVVVGDVDPDVVRERVPAATVLTVPHMSTSPNGGTRFLVADDSLALLGIRVEGVDEPTEVGLVSERPGTDVAVLLQRVVDTWIADAE